jgi:hypothetical protein
VSGDKKDIERSYLARFLELTRQTVRVIDTERPDFVLVSGAVRTGIELTRVAHRGESSEPVDRSGEPSPRRALAALARLYYAAGGQPLMVETSGSFEAEGPRGAALVERLVAVRAGMQANEALRLDIDGGGDGIALDLRAMPDTFRDFSRWNHLGAPADTAPVLGSALLEAAVVRKARHLPHYRRSLREVQLLLVADRIHDAARWKPPHEFTRLPKHGFDAVHLLLHPSEVHSVG